MATVITPAQGHVHEDTGSNSAMNLLVTVLVIAVVVFLAFYFGLPLMRSVGNSAPAPQQINNNAPPQGNAAPPQINIPDKVNVDINTPPAQ